MEIVPALWMLAEVILLRVVTLHNICLVYFNCKSFFMRWLWVMRLLHFIYVIVLIWGFVCHLVPRMPLINFKLEKHPEIVTEIVRIVTSINFLGFIHILSCVIIHDLMNQYQFFCLQEFQENVIGWTDVQFWFRLSVVIEFSLDFWACFFDSYFDPMFDVFVILCFFHCI